MSTAGDLLRANTTVALGTMMSRLTGFARYVLLVALVQPALADAYNTANNIPNQIYELALGGILTASLVPLFVEYADSKDDDATRAIVGTSLIGMLLLTVVAVVVAPLIVWVYTLRTPSELDVAQFRGVTTLFAVLCLPQILFYGLTFLATALLNARRNYFAAAWAPVVNNVIVILGLSTLGSKLESERTLEAASRNNTVVILIGLATTLGVVVMALALLPALRQARVPISLRFNRRHPAVRRLLKLSTWTIGYTVANQVALALVTILARPGSSGVTVYQLGYLIVQLPIGLLAMSVITTFGPELSRSRLAHDKRKLVKNFRLGLITIVGLLLPAGAALVALGRPLVSVVLERGFFTGESPVTLASTVAGFGVGLFALGGYLFALRGFYAHNDTRTPFAINLVENVLNVVLAIALVPRFGVAGLAWAFSIAYIVALILAVASFNNKLNGGLELPLLAAGFGRLVLSTIVCGEVMWLGSGLVGSDTGAGAWLRLIVVGVLGIAAYIGTLTVLQAPEVAQVRSFGR